MDGSNRILTSEISCWYDEAARLLYEAGETPHEWECTVNMWGIVMSSIIGFEEVDPAAIDHKKEEEKEVDSTTINQEVPESTSRLPKGVDSTTISDEKVLDNAIVGLETDQYQIKDQLTGEPRRLEIVAVVGMGGIGKTTLARAVFDDPLIQHHFYVRAWVKVSQVYQMRDLLLGILRSVAHLDDEMDRMSNEQLKEKLYRSLKGQRYLIVMDDMWSNQAWDDLRRSFPDDKNGSRVLLTSRLKRLADHVSSNPPHQMSFLNNEHSWELLHHQIILKQSCPSELEDIGMKIAEKCKGLPLAIIVVAGVLSSLSKTRECWENVANSMTSVLTSDPEKYHGILAMSYDYLPHHLKACFLYVCSFPEDCEIECRRLIRLWVAEGFVKPDGHRSLEEVAEDYLQDLIDRSLLSAVKRSTCGKLKSCCVHDLLWDLSLRVARKENFMHVIMTRQVQVPSEDNSIPRRLSFRSEGSADFHSVASIELTRSFLCFEVGFKIIQHIHANLSNFKFKLLRVLDIGFVRFDYFPLAVLELIHLRFLALTAACELPSSISQLWNLQTLIVHGPWIKRKSPMLPPGIWLLSHLRHLYLSAACYLPDPSKAAEIGKNSLVLLDLQTLSTLRPPSCTVEVVKNLPNLKKLGIVETKEDFDSCERSSHFLENLFHLHELETLKCFFYPQKSEKMRLPNWNAFPPGLKKLTLSWSYLPWEDMDTLTMLPKLEVLKLKNYAFQGAVWEPNEEGFQSLKLLLIEKTDLAHWKASKYNFPCLQYLVLRSCESLEEIPCDIADDLQLIELQYCSPSVESSAREIQEEQRNRDNDGLLVRIQSKRPLSSKEIENF